MATTRPSIYRRRRTAVWRAIAHPAADRARAHRTDDNTTADTATTDPDESVPADRDTASDDYQDQSERSEQSKRTRATDRAGTTVTATKDRTDWTGRCSAGRVGGAAVQADPDTGESDASRHAVIPFRAATRPLADSGTAAANSGGDHSGVWAVTGVITSQMVLITALLYYLGWVRTYSFLRYFGADPSMAGYDTADYVLRSITVAFPPFIHGAFAALALLALRTTRRHCRVTVRCGSALGCRGAEHRYSRLR